MKAAAVRDSMRAAGLEIIAAGQFSVSARSSDGCTFVHALEYPRGWRIQNARESRAATRAEIAREPGAVTRFCAELLLAGRC